MGQKNIVEPNCQTDNQLLLDKKENYVVTNKISNIKTDERNKHTNTLDQTCIITWSFESRWDRERERVFWVYIPWVFSFVEMLLAWLGFYEISIWLIFYRHTNVCSHNFDLALLIFQERKKEMIQKFVAIISNKAKKNDRTHTHKNYGWLHINRFRNEIGGGGAR